MGLEPKDGMLVIWPGWVPHEVEENKSDKQRAVADFISGMTDRYAISIYNKIK